MEATQNIFAMLTISLICHVLGSYHYQTNTVIKHFDWLTRMKQHNKDNHTVIIKFNRDKL